MFEMPMRERVARAIDPTLWYNLDRPDDAVVLGFPEERRVGSLLKADAAISAMREPSNRELEAGVAGYMHGVLACWQSIIDAALSEQSNG